MSSGKENAKSASSKNLLEEQRKKCLETRAGIDSFLGNLDLETEKIDTLTKAQEQKVENFIGAVNSEVDAIQTDAVNTFNEIFQSYIVVRKWLNNVYDSALKIGFLMIAFVTISYYLYHLYVNAWQIDATVMSAFLVIPITALFYLLMRDFKSRIDNRFNVNTQVDTARDKTKLFLKTHLKVNPSVFDSVTQAVNNAKNLGYKTLDTFRTYIPQLDDYYNSLERLDRQELFKRTLSNSLVSYGWEIKDDVNEYLKKFAPLTNSTQEWLSESSIGLSKKLNVPPVFITLAFSDYVGDLETSKNAWETIKRGSAVQAFVKKLIENKVVETEFFDSGSNTFGSIEELIAKQGVFNLEGFRELYHQFYFDLAQEKLSLIDSLHKYQFDLSNLAENRIKKFVPDSVCIDDRRNELIEFAASEITKPIEWVALAFYEQELDSEKRNKIWHKLCAEEFKEQRQRLVDYLVEKRLVDIPLQYRPDRGLLLDYLDSKILPIQDFKILNITSILDSNFITLEDTKKHILRALAYYNLGIDNEGIREKFQSLLLINDSEQALNSWVSSQLRISSDITELFYFDYIQDDRVKETFDRILKNDMAAELSETLLRNGIISRMEVNTEFTIDVNNLSIIIGIQKSFDRKAIQFYFDKCNRLLEYQREYAKFLAIEKMVESPTTNFGRVFEIIQPKINDNPLTLLNAVAVDYLEQNCQGYYGDWAESVTSAAIVLFLEQKNDYLVFEACRRASLDIKAVKVLYCRISVQERDELNAREKTPLKLIVDDTIRNTKEEYEFLTPFKYKLSQGSLYPKISVLVDAVLKDFQTNVKEKQEQLSGMVHRITKQVRVFLDGQLNYDITLKALKMNVVSAYMITTPATRVSVIGKVIGQYLPIICNETSATEDFLIISEEITGGKGTRLGIVPFGMSFDNFNDKFCKYFKQAVDRYLHDENINDIAPTDYAANLIRIVPSEAFFKRVVGGLEEEDIESENHPINTIRELMIERFPSLRNFELVASLKGVDKPTIVMKNLIIDLLNNQSKISLFIESEVRPLIGTTKLMDKIESGELDKVLVKEFSYTRLSELCTTTYKMAAKGNASIETARNKIKKNLEILRAKDDEISSEQINLVTESVMTVLQSWGAVIEGFSEESIWTAF